jgi:tellurite resistance protein TerC
MILLWLLFLVLVAGFLTLDLGVFHKTNQVITLKESLIWTLVWVMLAFLFGAAIYFIYRDNFFDINTHNISALDATIKYYTGFVIEKSLSLDNIFVIAMIFVYFRVPAKNQHRILFWGIIGAVIFRGIMIFLGAAIIERFSWSTYIFGVILFYSAIKMLTDSHENVDYSKNMALQLLGKIYPISWELTGNKYFIIKNGKHTATILFASLVVIEFSDVLFAVDSIPAIFAVTTDPFIIFTSNIFAILGLRNLYFFLANMMDKFRYMKFSLVFILAFVGVKMILVNHYKIPSLLSLIAIIGFLLIGIITSLWAGKKGIK